MAKAGELQWDELLNKSSDYKHTPSALWVNDPSTGVAPKNPDAKPLLKNEKIPDKQSDEEIAEFILRGSKAAGVRQPTDEEMFGHLVVSQEQIDNAKTDFDNKIVDFFKEVARPISGQTEVKDEEWASGKSFNSTLSKSQLAERNMFTGEE